jgi:hypothetical protein
MGVIGSKKIIRATQIINTVFGLLCEKVLIVTFDNGICSEFDTFGI